MKRQGRPPKYLILIGMRRSEPLAQVQKRSYKARFAVWRHGFRRGGRVVDRAALEMRSTRKGTGGSNPSLSANSELSF